MTDKLTPLERSAQMRKVPSAHTKPEFAVRRLAHALGFRFRLHAKELPGSPDLVFPRLRKAIFVHGCFWHGHNCRAGRNQPVSNMEYWGAKLLRNKNRDRAAVKQLKQMRWSSLVVWECQIRKNIGLEARIHAYLSGGD